MAVEDYKLPRIGRYGAVLIIDLSGTTFCDSAGVGAIIAAYRQARGN
jgi:anti-anti-sigma regulatory factor